MSDLEIAPAPGPYDFKTVHGPWAHGCERHYRQHRAYPDLGVGRAQIWITESEVTILNDLRIRDYGQPVPPEGVQTWDTDALRAEFDVLGFSAPYVVVRRKADGVKGVMEFTHYPRLYFDFQPEVI